MPVEPDSPKPDSAVRRRLIQQQHRLPYEEVAQLVASYLSGAPASELATQFELDEGDRTGRSHQPS